MTKKELAAANKEVRAAIRLCIKAADRDQKWLAARLRITQAYLSDMLQGRRSLSAKTVGRIGYELRLLPSEHGHLHRLGARAQGWEV